MRGPFTFALWGQVCWLSRAGGLGAKSCLTLETPWTVPRSASLCMGFPRQEHWSGLPFPSAGDLPGPGGEPGSPEEKADSLPAELEGRPLVVQWVKNPPANQDT